MPDPSETLSNDVFDLLQQRGSTDLIFEVVIADRWRRFTATVKPKPEQHEPRPFIIPCTPEARAWLEELSSKVSMMLWKVYNLGDTGTVFYEGEWIPALRYTQLPASLAADVVVWLDRAMNYGPFAKANCA